jgi:glycosyltransferase involved in cell wall biosynthesis
MNKRPPIVPGEHVLIITQVDPETPVGGVTVVLQNLLSAFDQESYTVAYLGRFEWRPSGQDHTSECYRLIPNFHPVQFLDWIFRGIKRRYAISRALRLVKAKRARIVVGLYPTLNSIYVATEVAKRAKVNYFPYLHDTIVEGLSHTNLAAFARRVQNDTFKTANLIMTMSEGMTDYYREAYGIKSEPLVHSYPEPIAPEPVHGHRERAFWGGEVYQINDCGFRRIQEALLACNTTMIVTSLSPLNIENKANVIQTFFPKRSDYIDAVRKHGILVLTLNWPDESDVHEAELATIFPTKTVEYLAAGGPMLVHCPESYFLAKFFRRHRCGLVVSERSERSLIEAVNLLRSGTQEVREMQDNALKTCEMFSILNVARDFRQKLAINHGVSLQGKSLS